MYKSRNKLYIQFQIFKQNHNKQSFLVDFNVQTKDKV
jgi:hypothetical protein